MLNQHLDHLSTADVDRMMNRKQAGHAHHILAYHLLSFAYSARVGLLIPHLRGLARVVPRLPEWLSERRRILGARSVSRTEFERFVSDRRGTR